MANKKTKSNPKGGGRKAVKNGKMLRVMIPKEKHEEAKLLVKKLIEYEDER
jgi:hypothetical protein